MELAEIIEIIKEDKDDNIKYGQELNTRLEQVFLGNNLDDFFKRNEYFESAAIHKERKKTTSNKDLIGRILQKEAMVFTARGGSCLYEGISTDQQKQLNTYLDNIVLGSNLRGWIQNFANKAYECDPMGVVFIEKDDTGLKPYPTYKSIKSIHKYKGNGQSLDYVCFHLTNKEADDFGVDDEELCKLKENSLSKYFRFVDETYDYIFKKDVQTITEVETKKVEIAEDQYKIEPMRLEHKFGSCPAIRISDIPNFQNDEQFFSKLDNIVELSELYLNDRSVMELTKKLHAFPKSFRPVVKCKDCIDGYIGGVICSKCGGTGRQKIVTVADEIEIALESDMNSIDINKLFGYITPPIETLKMQIDCQIYSEALISDGFWGTDNANKVKGINGTQNLQETATKTMTNLQPVYSRLERTAEWAESLERRIINFVGTIIFPVKFKNSSVKYGRDYILESTDAIYSQYLDYKTKGSPQYILNDYLDMYLRSKYQNNPIEMAVALKMMEVEPFVHYSVVECIALNISDDELKQKIYFPEWYNSVKNEYLFASTTEQLKKDLITFVSTKQLKEVAPVAPATIKDKTEVIPTVGN